MEQDSYREVPQGERYLDMLGLGALADQEFVGRNGGTYKYRDFLDHCGPEAQNALTGLESIGADDPRYETVRDALRDSILEHIKLPRSGN